MSDEETSLEAFTYFTHIDKFIILTLSLIHYCRCLILFYRPLKASLRCAYSFLLEPYCVLIALFFAIFSIFCVFMMIFNVFFVLFAVIFFVSLRPYGELFLQNKANFKDSKKYVNAYIASYYENIYSP